VTTLNVLITGAGGPLGQSILKATRSADLECRVIATDRHTLSVGFYWADSHYVLPSSEEPAYLGRLAAICRAECVDAVLIGSESEMHVLAEAKEAFEEETGAKVIVSPPEVLRIATDKWETTRFLATRGLAYPRSAIPEVPEQVSALVADMGFPLIVKPRSGSGSRSMFKVCDWRELEHVLSLVSDPVVQEYLQPDDQEYTTAAFVDDAGEPQGAIVMRRELAAGLTYRAWVEDNPLVAESAQAVVAALRPLGPCNVQLRLTERGPVPFEINARFSSTTSMRARFGYNEVEMALRCYVLRERIEPPLPRRGRALRFWDEFYAFAADDAADSTPVVPEAVAVRGL
jgi:carbamoyl-phosphate synthase large subunit